MKRPRPEDVHVFSGATEFRAWLEEHHATATELFVGYYRKRVAKQAITYVEAVEEALCFGWIDGIGYGMPDGELMATRFTPRRRTSNWSASNIARVARLSAAGRMRPAGLRAFEERDRRKDAVYSYEQTPELPAALLDRLRADDAAWQRWQAESASFQRQATFWVASAKRPDTQQRRFGELMDALRRGTRPRPFLVGSAERSSAK